MSAAYTERAKTVLSREQRWGLTPCDSRATSSLDIKGHSLVSTLMWCCFARALLVGGVTLGVSLYLRGIVTVPWSRTMPKQPGTQCFARLR